MTPITHVRYVALGVPDFAAERAFIGNTWGLVEVASEPGVAYFAARASTDAYAVRLATASQRQLQLLSLAVPDRAAVDAAHQRLAGKGAKVVWQPRELQSPGGGYGCRFFDVDGRLLELSADVQSRAAEAVAPRTALPVGIAHVVMHTPDVAATVRWYEDVLGMRVSDWLDGFMCFLRGGTTKHHCLAFLPGPAALNHIAYEMPSTDDLMRGLGRMLKAGVTLTWGPGRHTAGDNTFAYFATPNGNTFEYTAEVEHVPEDWTPRVLPRTLEVMDQWGTGRMTGPGNPRPTEPDPALWVASAL